MFFLKLAHLRSRQCYDDGLHNLLTTHSTTLDWTTTKCPLGGVLKLAFPITWCKEYAFVLPCFVDSHIVPESHGVTGLSRVSHTSGRTASPLIRDTATNGLDEAGERSVFNL